MHPDEQPEHSYPHTKFITIKPGQYSLLELQCLHQIVETTSFILEPQEMEFKKYSYFSSLIYKHCNSIAIIKLKGNIHDRLKSQQK